MINDEKYQISSTGTLTINKIDLEDQGDYVCIGKNDIGENQTEVKLTVKGRTTVPNSSSFLSISSVELDRSFRLQPERTADYFKSVRDREPKTLVPRTKCKSQRSCLARRQKPDYPV